MALMYPYVISCQCHPTNLEFSQFFRFLHVSCAFMCNIRPSRLCIDVSSEVFIFEIQYPRGPTPPGQCWTDSAGRRPERPERQALRSGSETSDKSEQSKSEKVGKSFIEKPGNSTNHIESCTFEYLFYQNYSIHLILRILLLLRTFEVQVFQGWSLRTRPLVHKNRQKPRPSWVLGDMDWRFALQVAVFPCFPQMCPQWFLCWPGWFRLRVLVAFWLRRLAHSVGTTWLMPEGLLYRRAMIVFELCKFFVAGVTASGVLRDRRRTSDTFSSAWHFCTLLKTLAGRSERWFPWTRGAVLCRPQ